MSFNIDPGYSTYDDDYITCDESTPDQSKKHSVVWNFPYQNTATSTIATSTTGLPQDGTIATSTTGLLRCANLKPEESYLILGQHIGPETRNVEFKQGGGGYLKRVLKDHVSKYVCGFLNSGEGGSLMVGVDDNGTVQGVFLTLREEDNTRLMIDSVIRTIRPQVFPQTYHVSFTQVVQEHNNTINAIENTKVLRISVAPTDNTKLYETARGEAYIRRDGSTQGPLHTSEIMEFANMLHEKEIKAKNAEINELRQTVRRLSKQVSTWSSIFGKKATSTDTILENHRDSSSSFFSSSSVCAII